MVANCYIIVWIRYMNGANSGRRNLIQISVKFYNLGKAPIGCYCYKLGSKIIYKAREDKDLVGVSFQDDFNPEKHINKIVGNTYLYKLLMSIKITFMYLDEDMIKKTSVTMTQLKLEYDEMVQSSHKKKDI